MKHYNKLRSTQLFSRQSGLLLKIGDLSENNSWQELPSSICSVNNRIGFRVNFLRLEKSGLIKTKKIKRKTYVKLTEKGKFEYLRNKMTSSSKLPDGLICIVVFDIPEKEKLLRDSLRKFLIESAFIPIQKSVLISQFNDAASMKKMFKMLKIEKWVRVFEAREI